MATVHIVMRKSSEGEAVVNKCFSSKAKADKYMLDTIEMLENSFYAYKRVICLKTGYEYHRFYIDSYKNLAYSYWLIKSAIE